MANLYELLVEYGELGRMMDDPDLSEEEADRLLQQLTDAKGTLQAKVDNTCRLLANIDKDIAGYRKEEERLAERRKTAENTKTRIREWIRTTMTQMDLHTIKTGVFQVSLSRGAPKVVITDANAIPEEFLRVKREVDKKAIMDTFKRNGECVPGTDIAEGEPSLRIR